jgi:hypothetical protein
MFVQWTAVLCLRKQHDPHPHTPLLGGSGVLYPTSPSLGAVVVLVIVIIIWGMAMSHMGNM